MKKLLLLALLLSAQSPAPRVVDIAAKRFEFTPNAITLKRGQPVTIRMTAADHSHGLFVKELHLDLDAAPGEPDQTTITPAEAGRFDAICDDYCGSGHGNMKMTIIVEN